MLQDNFYKPSQNSSERTYSNDNETNQSQVSCLLDHSNIKLHPRGAYLRVNGYISTVSVYQKQKQQEIPPPDSQRSMSALYKLDSSSRGPKLILISSRIAAWGHPPVSTARILSSGSAPCFTKNSPSSLVNISFVT